MGWYEEDRVREVYNGFRAAGFDCSLRIECRSLHQAHRQGVKRDHYWLDISMWSIRGESEEWANFLEVCSILNVTWKIDSKKISIEPFQSEWGPLHDAHKQADHRSKGFCAECEEDCYKPTNSALCDNCATTQEWEQWREEYQEKQERAAYAAQS